MRILLAAGIYPPQIGGPATYAKLLVEELPRRGVEVDVVKFSDVSHLPKFVKHAAYFWKVILNGKNADLIFAQDGVSVGLPALCAAFILRKKFFVRHGGDYAWEQATGHYGLTETLDEFTSTPRRRPLQITLFRTIQTFVAKHAKRVIVPSKYLASVVERWGVDSEKIIVVYNTSNLPTFSDARATLKRELGLQDQAIVSAGRLVGWKGFEVLIEAMPEVIRAFVDARLYLIGEGPDRNMLKKKIHDLGLEERVFLLGALPQEDLARYVKAADVFVLNTKYEGLSHQLIEAMSLGTPIVTTDIPGNRELIENKKTGTLVGYNDKQALATAIRDALSAGKEIDGMVARAKDKASTFTTDQTVRGTLAALTK